MSHQPKAIHRLTLVVTSKETVCEGIVRLDLRDPDGWTLPPFEAGGHIELHLPRSRFVRKYSICNDPSIRDRYTIMVQLVAQGRGGSSHIHEDLKAGEVVLASLPRNHLPIRDGEEHVMIAGGIGITPFLSMVPVLQRQRAKFHLHHAIRDAGQTKLTNVFQEPIAMTRYCPQLAGMSSRLDLAAILRSVTGGSQIYVCGPDRMLDEAVALAGTFGLEPCLHIERFGASRPGADADADYVAVLARSGTEVAVRSGVTMLEAIRDAGFEIPSSCEAGVCLECQVRYLSGTPVHRDLTMSPALRNEYLTPCVSGCASSKIVLDI